MDDYEFQNDNDVSEEEYIDDDDDVVFRYDKNNRDFEHCMDISENIKLKVGHAFYIV